MKVLIGYESSGMSRRAFRALGHDAWSCDFLPAADGSSHHIQDDVLAHLDDGWDLAIFHPTCTFLTSAAEWAYGDGPYHQKVGPGTLTGAARRAAREASVAEVKILAGCRIPRKVIENPVGVLSSRIGKPTQVIQPWQFGDDASKKTCLWIFGLPKLAIDPALAFPPRLVEWPRGSGAQRERWSNQTDSGQNALSPSAERWSLRSKTYPGIASAFASNWGGRAACPLEQIVHVLLKEPA